MPLLSVVIPGYNEEAFIGELLRKIQAVDTESLGFPKEIIVVDDGSTDRTGEIARSFEGVRVFTQVPNQGKGRAVQRGIRESTGDYILVQDADLEYDPNDYRRLLIALKRGADSVYGSRTLGQRVKSPGFTLFPGRHPNQRFGPWFAGQLLTVWTWLLYQRWLTDTLTAYKLYPANIVKSMHVRTTGFETDHEITAKLVRRGCKIIEEPIEYMPRGAEAGKKIRARDGFVAVWTLLKYRFVD
ncbi:MAG TPA: glycosyltransferase family 2 protein [Bryobacteraceae bacterium]|jgi:glycosyltransferase involved in cell wall biosynthesis|nr:glycosyltransferase family 2 protein [Bryobacteraceae bacterium]